MNEPTKKDSIKTILIVVFALIAVGSVGFIAYDKLIKKENPITEENNKVEDNKQEDNKVEEETEKNETSNSENNTLDDEIYKNNNNVASDYTGEISRFEYIISNEEKQILKDLFFPFDYINGSGSRLWSTTFEEFNFDTMRRDEKMILAASLVEMTTAKGVSEIEGECQGSSDCFYDTEGMDYEIYATGKDLKNMYIKLFGTESGFSSGNIDYIKSNSKKFDTRACPSLPHMYDSKRDRYYGNGRCGGDGPDEYFNVVTKVEKDNDKIYVNVAVAYVNVTNANEAETINDQKLTISAFKNQKNVLLNSRWENLDKDIISLAKENKLSNYKFTFKKQADGKYYVYSGEWQ